MKNQFGYSLIEIVITIVFIGVAFPGLIAFFANTINDSVENEIYTQAIGLTQSKMEEITADKLDDSRGIPFIRTAGQYPVDNIGQFTRTVTVKDSLITGVSGVFVQVETSHALMANNFSLSCYFTIY